MSRFTHALTTRLLRSASLLLALATSPASLAQQAPAAPAVQPIQLPGIVVQGATLERAPIARRRTPAASNDADIDAPAPQPKATPPINAPATTQPAAASAPATPAADTDRLSAGIPATEIGTSVTVVTAKDITQQQARTAADVLRGLPGVTVTPTGSVGSVTVVRLRGEDQKHTRVLVDGIEVNTTKDAFYDFSNLSPDDIARIEVIRGPMSALYGSGALGGVINIETKAAQGPLSLQVRSELGSFGTRDLAARLAAGNEFGYFSLTGQQRNVTGFAVAPGGHVLNGTNLGTVGFRGGLTLAPTVKLDVTLRYSEKRAGFDDFGVDYVTPAKLKPFQTADDANNKLIERNALAGVRLGWDSFNGALTQELKSNYTSNVSANRYEPVPQFPGPVTINNTRDEGTRLNYGYSATYRLPADPTFGRHAVTGLIEKQTETFKPFSDFDTSFGDYNGDGLTRTRNRLSYAGEWRGTFAERLSLTAGARRDLNDTFQDFNTWRTSASYDIKEIGLRPHASLGTGVRLPGMYDQFGANSKQYTSNALLRPETSRGYDLGLEQKFLGGRALIDATYFHSDVQNRIFLNCCVGSAFKFFPDNAPGLSTRRGIELSGRYEITSFWSIGGAYTYTDARDPNGDPEFRRVPHSGRADTRVLFDEGRGTLSFAAIGNGQTPDKGFLNDGSFASQRVQLPGYWLVQAAASYKIQPNVELYGRVENALNRHYQDVYGYNTAGIGVYGGVKVSFDDLVGTNKK